MRDVAQDNEMGATIGNKVNVRIIGAKRRTKMSSLKANMIGKLIQVRGTVIRVSNVQPYLVCMPFECACGEIMDVFTSDGKYGVPRQCSASGCRSKRFEAIKSDARTVDIQYIKLQEEMGMDAAGRVPRSLECEMTEDLVDSCVPGDVVTINGIVKAISNSASTFLFKPSRTLKNSVVCRARSQQHNVHRICGSQLSQEHKAGNWGQDGFAIRRTRLSNDQASSIS